MPSQLICCKKKTCICHCKGNISNIVLCDSIQIRPEVSCILVTWMESCNILVKKVTKFHISGYQCLIFESIFSPSLALDCNQKEFEYWVEKHWQNEKPMYTKIHDCIKYTQITPWTLDVKEFYDKIVEKLVLFHNKTDKIVGNFVLFHNKTDKNMEDVITSRITQYNVRWDMKKQPSNSST